MSSVKRPCGFVFDSLISSWHRQKKYLEMNENMVKSGKRRRNWVVVNEWMKTRGNKNINGLSCCCHRLSCLFFSRLVFTENYTFILLLDRLLRLRFFVFQVPFLLCFLVSFFFVFHMVNSRIIFFCDRNQQRLINEI